MSKKQVQPMTPMLKWLRDLMKTFADHKAVRAINISGMSEFHYRLEITLENDDFIFVKRLADSYECSIRRHRTQRWTFQPLKERAEVVKKLTTHLDTLGRRLGLIDEKEDRHNEA